MYNTPMVIEQEGRTEKAYDVISRLYKDRIILLNGPIDDDVSASIVAQLLFLSMEDEEKEIFMYINSPGGVITSGMAIYDTMNYIPNDVTTICIGQAASMGAFLLSSGTKGKRFTLPHSRVMIHQPLGGAEGQASDILIQAKEILYLKDSLNKILAENTGKDLSIIEKDTDRDFFMNAQESLDYGIVDKIITKKLS